MIVKSKPGFPCKYHNCKSVLTTQRRFENHIKIVHDEMPGKKTNWSMIWTILGIILTLVLFIIATVFSSDVSFWWDKHVRGLRPQLYISVNSVFLLNNTNIVNLSDNELRTVIVERFIRLGVLSGEVSGKTMGKSPVVCAPQPTNFCGFFQGDNLQNISSNEDNTKLPHEVITQKERWVSMSTRMPDHWVLEQLKFCENCVAHVFYLENTGNRSIDIANFKLCFDKRYQIQSISSDRLEQETSSCIRIKRENIASEEEMVGAVILKNTGNLFDLTDEPIKDVSGTYTSKGKEFKIDRRKISRLTSALVPNCNMPADLPNPNFIFQKTD